MTRQHFQSIADSLRMCKPTPIKVDDKTAQAMADIAVNVWRKCCENVADSCKSFNAGFKRERFLDACGYNV